MRPTLVLVAPFCCSAVLFAQSSVLKDINVDPIGDGSSPTPAVRLGAWSYFNGSGPEGQDLYKTQGTAASTVLVKDFWKGQVVPLTYGPGALFEAGGRMYLLAGDATTGQEPWISDGTDAGTVPLGDLFPGGTSSRAHGFVAVGSRVVFVADHPTAGKKELWVTNGTAAGTKLLFDTRNGDGSITGLTGFGSYALFRGMGTTSTTLAVWVTDGTAAGTKRLSVAADRSDPGQFVGFKGHAYFSATTAGQDFELWRTDGTAANTVLVKDIFAGAIGSFPLISGAVMGGHLYFSAKSLSGVELFRTDGTASGTVLFKDLLPGTGSSRPESLCAVGSKLYFSAAGLNNTGHEPWVSDGTASGTILLRNISPSGSSSDPQEFHAAGTGVVFSAYWHYLNGNFVGRELWYTDGTQAGTVMVADLYPGRSSNGKPNQSSPLNFHTTSTGRVMFSCETKGVGREWWTTDGTKSGTALMLNLNPDVRTYSSNAGQFHNVHGSVWFAASDLSGAAGWETDGTSAGTRKLPITVAPTYSTMFRDKFFYLDHGLWATDGRTETKIHGAMTSGIPPVVSGRSLFYVAYGSGYELFVSDGTTTGTSQVKDIRAGTATSSISGFFAIAGGKVVFRADDGVHGPEPWVSDGTSAGTFMLRDIRPGSSSSGATLYSTGAAALGGKVYFQADDGVTGRELWVTDGTQSGTQLLANINPGAAHSAPTGLARVEDRIFFMASDGNTGYELWVSDGTAIGTRLFKDIVGGAASSFPSWITPMAGRRFVFRADDGVHGREPWVSDGTAAGTNLLQDVRKGAAHGAAALLWPVGSRKVFFQADDGVVGKELWVTDGTSSGTQLVENLSKSGDSQLSSTGAYVAGKLVYSGLDPVKGKEPRALFVGATRLHVGHGYAANGRIAPTMTCNDPVMPGTLTISGASSTGTTAMTVLGFPGRMPMQMLGPAYVNLDLTKPVIPVFSFTMTANWQFAVNLPLDPALRGATAALQTIVTTNAPTGFDLTNAVFLYVHDK